MAKILGVSTLKYKPRHLDNKLTSFNNDNESFITSDALSKFSPFTFQIFKLRYKVGNNNQVSLYIHQT